MVLIKVWVGRSWNLKPKTTKFFAETFRTTQIRRRRSNKLSYDLAQALSLAIFSLNMDSCSVSKNVENKSA